MKLQLTGNDLKIIAMITMFIDHFGYIFFPEISIFRIIGRISFPIYAYLISEGCKYTKDRKKYFLQIFILGIICSLAYIITIKEIYFCVLITFSISILLIYLFDYVKKSFKKRGLLLILAILGVGILCKYLYFDYDFFGILVPLMVYIPNTKLSKIKMFLISLIFLIIFAKSPSFQVPCLISMLFIIMYNGKRGKLNLKWFFYLFYPIHIVLLMGVAYIIF